MEKIEDEITLKVLLLEDEHSSDVLSWQWFANEGKNKRRLDKLRSKRIQTQQS